MGTTVWFLSACGGQQPEACADFVACVDEYKDAFDVPRPSTSDYEENGRCWQDPRLFDVCEEQCEDGKAAYGAALEEAGLDAGACGG